MEFKHLPESISTPRLILRKHRRDQSEIMFQLVEQDRQRLREFLPWVDLSQKAEDTLAYIEEALEKWKNYQLYDYGIFRSEDSTYMGNIGVHNINWDQQRCEIGYWIAGPFEGKGYMSEAVRALEQACFKAGFHRVEIRCSAKNLRSAAVPQRLGYHLDGCLRQDSIEHGKFRDTLVFSKLKTDLKP